MWPWSKPQPIPDHRSPLIAALERELDRHVQERRQLVAEIVALVRPDQANELPAEVPLPESQRG
jgi:hypothetical protein